MSTNNRKVHANSRKAPPAASLAASVLAILATTADAQAVTEWDLPGQPLAQSLRAVAARTDSNIIFDKKLVVGHSAPPLKTRATTEEALTQLLEGTGLTHRQLDDKTVTIQLASADKAATTSAIYGGGNERIRLAQAETGASKQPAPAAATPSPTVLLLEEIVVTGTNIRGIENNTAPVTVLSREYIDATGYGTVTKLLESVTQNFALASQSGQQISGVSGGNREQSSAINLRGIGEGTTLVLLNGRRLAPGFRAAAVDISAIPLSAIERVEILPDGASALYGSDAIGGVVNFILREDFEGVETRLRAGSADGVDEYRASQALGNAWDSGNALLSLEYYKRDLLSADERDFVPAASTVGSLLPEDENYSAVLTGRQDIAGSVGVFSDVLYTNRESFNASGRSTFNESAATESKQLAATLGVDWKLGADWQVALSGSYAENQLDQSQTGSATAGGAVSTTLYNFTFDSQTAELKADGTLFNLPGGKVSMAIGAAYREEAFEEVSRAKATGTINSSIDTEQDVSSVYAELYIPVVGRGNALPGVQRLELSLAGRYDDYSTAGSSVDPQAGLMWEPVNGLRLRSRYGTSYKAPNLVDFDVGRNTSRATRTSAIPGYGTIELMQISGTDAASLRPQESETASFGLEITPPSITGLAFSANYYKIRYTDFIATPASAVTVALADLQTYGSVVTLAPSVAQVNQAIAIGQQGLGFFTSIAGFTPDMVDVIVDLRRRNVSQLQSSGLDLASEYNFGAGESRIFLGLGGTYVFNRDLQVTAQAAQTDTADTIYNPPSWRARAFVSWQLKGWAANVFVNHTDSYKDTRAGTPAAQRDVSSYTTVDTRLAYDFSKRFSSGFLSGFSVALSAQNVLDEDPPALAISSTTSFDVGYDPTNASPLGRLIALEFTKTWGPR